MSVLAATPAPPSSDATSALRGSDDWMHIADADAALVNTNDRDLCPLDCCDNCCSGGALRWQDNLSYFVGIDGSKQPQDLGVNAHLGGRVHVNLGIPFSDTWGIGGQIGTAVTYSDAAVGAVEALQGTRERFQSFTTVGVFQRTGDGWKWGLAYDFLAQNYYEGITLGQWRGMIGYSLNECHEVGVWFTASAERDTATFLTDSLTLEPIALVNGYWRRTWEAGPETTFWAGASESHGQEIILFPTVDRTGMQFVFGADIHAPLTDSLAIFGETNFVTPSDSGTVDAYLGIIYYPGGGARAGRRRRFAPVLPVASSPSFAVDLVR